MLKKPNSFIDNFQDCINQIIALQVESFFILGDFNDRCVAWDTDHKDSELGNKLVNLTNMNNIFQIVQEPTHVTDHSQSC